MPAKSPEIRIRTEVKNGLLFAASGNKMKKVTRGAIRKIRLNKVEWPEKYMVRSATEPEKIPPKNNPAPVNSLDHLEDTD
jgi:hypothetical protein